MIIRPSSPPFSLLATQKTQSYMTFIMLLSSYVYLEGTRTSSSRMTNERSEKELEILRIQRVSPLVVKKFKIIVQPRLRVDRRFIFDGIVNEYVRKTLVAEDTSNRNVIN